MKKRRGLFLLALLFIASLGRAQQVDTTIILKNLKLKLFAEVNVGLLNGSALNDYLMRELKVTYLHSTGFDNFLFIKIDNQILAVDTNHKTKRIIQYSTPICLRNGEKCYFVYGYNIKTNEFIRLHGTKENEFGNLYNGLKDTWKFWQPYNKITKSTARRFAAVYSIEGLDLDCLLLSLKTNKGSCLDYFSPDLIID